MSRKILITGGAGFIASSLADRLIQDPDNFVVIVDNLLTGKNENLPDPAFKNWKFIRCDVNEITDLLPIMSSYSFDYVFHYAAVVGVQRTLDHPVMVLKDIQGIKNILDLSKNTGVKRFFYASSSEVYGESIQFPQNEISTPLNSRLPYAVVKNVGESFCRSYWQEYGLKYTIFRFFNTYGPKQSKDFVISKFLAAAKAGQEITVIGDGTQCRTFCYIDDNIDATLAIFYEKLFINDVVNIGNDQEYSIATLAEMICEITESNSKIIQIPALKEGDMKRRMPDLSRMRTLLNRDLLGLKDGLKKMLSSQFFQV